VTVPLDGARFGDALHRALPRLRRIAIALTGNLSRADDLVQDCLERAWRARSTMASPDIPFAWLRMILHNAHIDWFRRHGHEATHDGLEDLAEELSVVADQSLTLDLIAALQRISADQRAMLLSSMEGLSYREMADELAVPIGTVMSRLARARAALREQLEPGVSR
jgi:RNA polymerase sigma-70 factor (ECF subfamily)